MKKFNANVEIPGVGGLFAVTGLLKYLWNKLFPELFGWKKITYWQSLLLYLISKTLFDTRFSIKESFNVGNVSYPKSTKAKVEPKMKEEANFDYNFDRNPEADIEADTGFGDDSEPETKEREE